MFWGLISQALALKGGGPDVTYEPFRPQGEAPGLGSPCMWSLRGMRFMMRLSRGVKFMMRLSQDPRHSDVVSLLFVPCEGVALLAFWGFFKRKLLHV